MKNKSKFSADVLMDKFIDIICKNDPKMVAYIYRLDAQGKVITPYWLKLVANEKMPRFLQAKGGGEFRIIIRRRRDIKFSGTLGFAPIDARVDNFLDSL